MSYVQCLWSPLLGDWGVLGEPFVTVHGLSKKGLQYYSSRKVNSKCFCLGNISPASISLNRGRSSWETDVRAKLSIVSQRKGVR